MVARPVTIGWVMAGVEVLQLASHSLQHLRQRARLRRNAFEACRVGGRLALYAPQWRGSPWAYNVTSRGLRWQWKVGPPPYRPFYQPATPLLESFAQTLLDSGATEKFSSSLFKDTSFLFPRRVRTKGMSSSTSPLSKNSSYVLTSR